MVNNGINYAAAPSSQWRFCFCLFLTELNNYYYYWFYYDTKDEQVDLM